VVRAVASQLRLAPNDARGSVTPEGKLEAVREAIRTRRGTVVMVGDGVNDAAALAAATVGIAVQGGAEASLAAADVYLTHPGLSEIANLTAAARSTMWTIRLCLVASLMYNVIAATLSVAGLISPLIAAILMPASSLTVLALCARTGAFKPPRSNS
jgi:Cu2+-exporting ATPase